MRENNEGFLVAKKAINELRHIEQEKSEVFKITPDIDIVWVLSQPGTYLTPPENGPYKGINLNKKVIDCGVDLVKQITSLKLKQNGEKNFSDNISKLDIINNGPILFYNGEDKNLEGFQYTQNEDFEQVINSNEFPLPKEKIIIDNIDQKNTPAQVSSFMNFFKNYPDIHKVLVISSLSHSRRVGRYLEDFRIKHPDLFLSNIEFIGVFVSEDENKFGITLNEMRKIKRYYQKGDLSENSLKGF